MAQLQGLQKLLHCCAQAPLCLLLSAHCPPQGCWTEWAVWWVCEEEEKGVKRQRLKRRCQSSEGGCHLQQLLLQQNLLAGA